MRKNTVRIPALLLAAALAFLCAFALGEGVRITGSGDFEYTTAGDGSIRITRYTGNETAVAVPAALDGMPVKTIGAYAFRGCGSVTAVQIPEGVVTLEDGVFAGCGSLLSVTIPRSVAFMGKGIFENCGRLTVSYYDNSPGRDYCMENALASRREPFESREIINRTGRVREKTNLRENAGVTHRVLAWVPAGAAVLLLERSVPLNGELSWTHVQYEGRDGYIQTQYLEFPEGAGEQQAGGETGGTDESAFLSPMETRMLFETLGGTPLIAASGAGAWEGRLYAAADGSFTGIYYDEDADVIYEVSFRGAFSPAAEKDGPVYRLHVETISARNTPGTAAQSEYGIPVEYTDPPFREGEPLILTLPGTPDEAIPETVRGEIGGTYDIWEDYSGFVTLTRARDGWGFFGDPSMPAPPPLEPTPVTGAGDAPSGTAETPARDETPAPEETVAEDEMPVRDEDPSPEETIAGDGMPVREEISAEDGIPIKEGVPAAADASGWTGFWMTRDESLAEMLVTDGGDGTLRVKGSFLRTMDLDAVLIPQADGTMRFESAYGALTGRAARQADGAIRLEITGGYSYDDEEATEYYGYFSRGFLYYPAAYGEVWYETPGTPPSEDDWTGTWTVRAGARESTLVIEPRGNGLFMTVSFSNGYSFSGMLEKSGETDMDFAGGEEFFCFLSLNRKLGRIAMTEVGAVDEGVYAWLEPFYYNVVEYSREPAEGAADGNREAAAVFGTPEKDIADQGVIVTPMEEDSESTGLLPVEGAPGWLRVPVGRADATTYIEGSDDPTAYMPFRMIDGDENTSFQFSLRKAKAGKAFVYFEFDGPAALDAVWIKNGNWFTSDGLDRYNRNCRVKKMTVSARYAGSEEYTELKTVTLKDDKARQGWQEVSLPGLNGVTGIRFRIDSVYTGSKFKNDVCISEVMFVKAEEP